MRLCLTLLGLAAIASAQEGMARQMASIEAQKRGLARVAASVHQQKEAAVRQRLTVQKTPFDSLPPVESAFHAEPAWTYNLPLNELQCRQLDWTDASEHIDTVEKKLGLPEGLLSSVALQESGLHPCAVSRSGAMGLMQLMPETASNLNVQNPFDPWESLEGGAKLLRSLLDRYNGDVTLALSAYNAGPSRVDAFGGMPPYAETRNYVDSILARLSRTTSPEIREQP